MNIGHLLTGIAIPIAIAGTGLYISESQKDADRVAILVPSLASENSKEKNLALALIKHYKEKEQLTEEINLILGEYYKDKETYSPKNKSNTPKIEQEVDSLIPRIFFHITDENQRKKPKELEIQLESIGYIAPGIERVNRGPSSIQLRYFRKNGKEPKEAKTIAKKIKDLAKINVESKYISGYENKTRPRHYELWM